MAAKNSAKTKKSKPKIYRKYEDFYTAEELLDPDTLPRINLNISDFDARGHILNPRAPCVVTTIDPDYTKAARQQRHTRKFRMKTDILCLREIMRKKFMIYATQQLHLEKQRETERLEQTYQRLIHFADLTAQALSNMESRAFKEMKASQLKLQSLQEVKLADELKTLKDEHQRVLMEVNVTYDRLRYLIKLISYFDIIEGEDASDNDHKIELPPAIATANLGDNTKAGRREAALLEEYMQQVARPYLARRQHLNAEVWLQGYEQMRCKIFNYHKRFTNLALLNHIVALVYEKFQKTNKTPVPPPILKDAHFLTARVASLKARAVKTLNDIECQYKRDTLTLKLNAIIPIILKNMESTFRKSQGAEQDDKSLKSKTDSVLSTYREQQVSTLAKVERIQEYLQSLLNEFDTLPPELCKTVEKRVRRRVRIEKDMSRRALVKQTRLYNWMAHFKKHELQRQQEKL